MSESSVREVSDRVGSAPRRRSLTQLVLMSATAALITVGSVAACGSDSDESPDSSTTTTVPAQGNAPSGAPGGAQFQQIQQCLSAAGITLPTPSGSPPQPGPSGFPAGGIPSGGVPSALPSGAADVMKVMQDPKAQDALKACGISLPTPPAGN